MDEGVQKVFNMHKLNVQFQGPLETIFQNWEEEFWKTVTLLMAKFPTLNKTDLHKLAPCCTPPPTLTTMHKTKVQLQGLLREHFPKLEKGEDILEIISLLMAKLLTLDSRLTHNGMN